MGINSIDDFINDRSGGGSGGRRLKKWKDDGEVDVWLHTECMPMKLWLHRGMPRVRVYENRKTGETERSIYSGNWVCLEDESVLGVQYRRGSDGKREREAHYCPLCRLTDVLREMVRSGKLEAHTPIFKFEGDDPKFNVTLVAGGMFMGAKELDELDEEASRAFRKAGVAIKDLWKQSGYAKQEWLFCVVDNANPEAGVQTAIEKKSLGDAVKGVIAGQRKAYGVEEGNPLQNPYAIKWEFDKKAAPGGMYSALAMPKMKLTGQISDLIHGEVPNIDKIIAPFNVKAMRLQLEELALVQLPFDEIFDVKTRKARDPEEEARPVAKVRAAVKAPPPPASSKAVVDEEDDQVECDACGKGMHISATTCGHCGAVYGPDGKIVVAEQKPAPRKRSDVQAKAAPLPPKQQATRQPGDDEEEDEDSLPF